LDEVIARTDVRHVLLAAMGDMLGVVAWAAGQFAVRHVRK
jgi:hypothetical protein